MPTMFTTTTPISNNFKEVIVPVATALSGSSMERGTGMLLEYALAFYRNLHPEVSSPQTAFFQEYIRFAKDSGLYAAVKGNGKKNRSFRITGEPAKCAFMARMRAKYMIGDNNHCIRLLLPIGIAVQPTEPLNGFTFPAPFDGWLKQVAGMVDAHAASFRPAAAVGN